MDQKDSVTLEFTEDMHGFYVVPESQENPGDDLKSYMYAYERGKEQNKYLNSFTIAIADIDEFIKDPKLEAKAIGYIEAPEWGGRLNVSEGKFNLFLSSDNERDPDIVKEMHYTLYFEDKQKRKLTFFGYKAIKEDKLSMAGTKRQLSTPRVWEGHSPEPSKVIAYGVLRLTASDFARQMTTFKSSGKNLSERANALLRFTEIFAST